MTAIDADGGATWVQLRERLREVRAWAEAHEAPELLAILNRPRETGDD